MLRSYDSIQSFRCFAQSRRLPNIVARICGCLILLVSAPDVRAGSNSFELAGVPVEFALFALTLIAVAIFHRHTLQVALTGLAAIVIFKSAFTGFGTEPGWAGLVSHLQHEWVLLANLLFLLLGFALLSDHFEKSRVPELVPRFLPEGWKGCFVLLAIVFALSGVLDNIAAALLGGTIAMTIFQRRVHLGYLAAIVAVANAGGAGSVFGDTTTTMMWLGGVNPLNVIHAYLGAAVALLMCGIPASFQQQSYSPITRGESKHTSIDWPRLVIVLLMLTAVVASNVMVNLHFRNLIGNFPAVGTAIWIVLLACAWWRKPSWNLIPEAFKGTLFLLALVLCASLMPVDRLPPPTWLSSLWLGFISSVFDNIPLTALALKQGGYDWGLLAFAVGFGGSMTWFGSSAGVALANLYPEAKSIVRWIRYGWHVPLAYLAGFAAMLAVTGWKPA